ncbi:MAG: hypothetical protein Q7T82_16020 [Armatimonadota bacterium]|nr:hypothetical protein [Armatimonadota bacterium]
MECHICHNTEANEEIDHHGKGTRRVYCDTCGTYLMTRRVFQFLSNYLPEDMRKVARWLYNTRDEGERFLSNEPLSLEDAWKGKALDLKNAGNLYMDDGAALEKYESAISRIAAATRKFGQRFTLRDDRWLVPTIDDQEADSVVQLLVSEGYLAGAKGSAIKDPFTFFLMPKGLTYVENLSRKARIRGNRVFVAACFHDDLKPVVKTIRDVVSGLGYNPKVVTDPHTNLIDLEIYERIRESRFIVADLTCNRQSVYYEVGFAHGLGIDVVLACQHDHFEDKSDDSKWVHFDLNHRSVLVWKDYDELAKMLRQHIWQVFGRVGDSASPPTI